LKGLCIPDQRADLDVGPFQAPSVVVAVLHVLRIFMLFLFLLLETIPRSESRRGGWMMAD